MVIRSRSLSGIAVLVALALVGVAVPAPRRTVAEDVRSAGNPADAPASALYAAADVGPSVPLDPIALADLPGGAPLDLGGDVPDWLVSGDGSTLVRIEHAAAGAIVVSDGIGGSERLRFRPPAPVFAQGLSRDGARLVAQAPMACGPGGCSRPVWYVFDTRDGGLIARVEGDDRGYGPHALVDPEGLRLYRLVFDQGASPGEEREGPWPLAVVAYDLTSGAEVGRRTVPGARGGIWFVRSIAGVPIADELVPAVALSPDGTRLAVVHAAADRVTLIDAATLTVESAHALTRVEGLGDRLLRWLGIAPEVAEAKFMAGRRLEAVFAPSGRHLYVFGAEGSVDDTAEDIQYRGLGLRLIDVDTGRIVAEALDGAEIVNVLPSADGRDVYVNGPTVPWTASTGELSYLLRRLDAGTLETLAEREFPDRRWVVLVTAGPAPSPRP